MGVLISPDSANTIKLFRNSASFASIHTELSAEGVMSKLRPPAISVLRKNEMDDMKLI
jgi:hypothetical protein